MSIPGPKPKPTPLKQLEGNPGKRPLNQSEPMFQGPKPRKPSGLPYHASAMWDKLAGPLYEHGLLTYVDVPVFESMCLSFHFMKQAANQLKKDGITAEDERGLIRKHPANQIFRDNMSQVLKCATQFGLTPSSRSRLNVDTGDKEPSLAEQLFSMIDGAREG